MGKKNLKAKAKEADLASELFTINQTRGNRPFKTRNKVGERPIGIRQQRQKRRDLE